MVVKLVKKPINMKLIRINITADTLRFDRAGFINLAKVDATTEEDILAQIDEDDQEERQDAGKFVQRLRKRLSLNQVKFAGLINVSVNTIRDWERGRRYPTGAAKALLKILDRAPEAALAALRSTNY